MLIIAANRLPVEQVEGIWHVAPGGLVTALRPVLDEIGGRWVGWTGEVGGPEDPLRIDGLDLAPVALDRLEIHGYYEGFSNSTLWPLYHDKVNTPEFHRHWWRPYVDVNRRFARRVADEAPQGAAVWVHDYHLSLVPAAIRELRDDLRVGFFLHIPFPPMELFAQLPWRREILRGMLGADAVAFQTPYGARNFRAVARRYMPARVSRSHVEIDDRRVRVGAFPIGIDSAAFAHTAALPEVEERVRDLQAEWGGRRVLLGVDRLDYTKGIARRLRAFETLLDRRPELADEVVFVQIVVPSRENIMGYQDMRGVIERTAGRINGKHSRVARMPVHYHYASLPRPELVAHYRAADVMVVSPPRDGMNLVAKEYVAAQVDGRGVLVLSEFAGAALELTQAVLINPYDLDGMADAIERALKMGDKERRRRMRLLRQQVMSHDVHRWARAALEAFSGLP